MSVYDLLRQLTISKRRIIVEEDSGYTAGKHCFVQGRALGRMVSSHSSCCGRNTERNHLDCESLSWHVNQHKHGHRNYHDGNAPRHSVRLHLSSVSFLFLRQCVMHARAAQRPHCTRLPRSLRSFYAPHGRTDF